MITMEPAFKHKEQSATQPARLELREKLLLVFSNGKVISQCNIFHPGLKRHIMKTEQIFRVKIHNKEWMMREVEAIINGDEPG